jgi:hypothetical protein
LSIQRLVHELFVKKIPNGQIPQKILFNFFIFGDIVIWTRPHTCYKAFCHINHTPSPPMSFNW